MAEIIVWPHTAHSRHAKQIAGDLTRAIAGEADLGPRGPHMQVLSANIIKNIESLRGILKDLRSGALGVHIDDEIFNKINEFADTVDNSAKLASLYSEIQQKILEYES